MLPSSQRRGDCKACRERKTVCDKKRPRCTACVEANKPCGGYDLGQFFINVSSHGPPPVWNRSQNAQKYLVLDLDSQPPVSGPSPSSVSRTPWQLPAFTNPDPNDIPSITSLFLELYYRGFNGGQNSSGLLQPGMESGGWRALLPSWVGKSPVLDTAIGAMTACFVGTQYQDDSLLDQSNTMYLNALQMVQQALPEPNSAQRTDLLATTLVLSSTEMFMSNGGGASQLTHIEGATRLLRMVFNHQDFEELHVYVLNQGLFEAIFQRRRYHFSSPSYRPLIRRLYSCQRTHQNNLYFQWTELILPLPNILASTDTVSAAAASASPAPPSAAQAVLDDLSALEASLAVWHESLKANTLGPWTFPTAQSTTEGVPFPLQFSSIEVCTLYSLHWMCQLLILDARSALLACLPLAPIPTSLAAQLSEYASLICRSVQFCTSNTSYAAAENMFLPLFVTASYYSRTGDFDRMKWCVSCFTKIAQEQKIGFSIERIDLSDGTVNHRTGTPHTVWDEA
ncbi:hypothetical protein BDV96DRAFT_668810 [Lophiotrema nucula]|uniref:Zn(2)-C6 fungal-type domain-containing protein n=1 Tax=Lophiotrema nucula TaxID=690887 RepID=A0A6A5YUU3_9PLEO|nr:hypothetical protein BDV96DRAFT_668810 [Lophiotrema nucula]